MCNTRAILLITVLSLGLGALQAQEAWGLNGKGETTPQSFTVKVGTNESTANGGMVGHGGYFEGQVTIGPAVELTNDGKLRVQMSGKAGTKELGRRDPGGLALINWGISMQDFSGHGLVTKVRAVFDKGEAVSEKGGQDAYELKIPQGATRLNRLEVDWEWDLSQTKKHLVFEVTLKIEKYHVQDFSLVYGDRQAARFELEAAVRKAEEALRDADSAARLLHPEEFERQREEDRVLSLAREANERLLQANRDKEKTVNDEDRRLIPEMNKFAADSKAAEAEFKEVQAAVERAKKLAGVKTFEEYPEPLKARITAVQAKLKELKERFARLEAENQANEQKKAEQLKIPKLTQEADKAVAEFNRVKDANDAWNKTVNGPAKQKRDDAQAALKDAQDKLASMNATNTPRITYIEMDDSKAAVFVRNQDYNLTSDIDQKLALAKARYEKLEEQRKQFKAEALAASKEVSDATDKLVNKIWLSYLAQMGVVAANEAVDFWKAAREGGVAGVGAEAAKKILEMTTKIVRNGTWQLETYFEPNDQSVLQGKTVVETSWDLLIKEGAIGPLTGLGKEAAYKSVMDDMHGRIDKAVVNGLSDAKLELAISKYEHAADHFAELKKPSTLGAKAKGFGWDVFFTAVRDYAKDPIKQALANIIEGEEWKRWADVEGRRQWATVLWLKASTLRTAQEDEVKRLEAEKARIDKLVKEKQPFQNVSINQEFKNGAQLDITLTDSGLDKDAPYSRIIKVTLGGKEATRVGTDLKFRIKAEDLAHDGQGGVKFDVFVER